MLFVCPGAQIPTGFTHATAVMFETAGGNVPGSSPTRRVFGYPEYTGPPAIAEYPPSKLCVIDNPTEQVVWHDTDKWKVGGTWENAAPDNPAHGGSSRARRNVMFLDGHVILQHQRPTGGM